jgi:hypothetical protein
MARPDTTDYRARPVDVWGTTKVVTIVPAIASPGTAYASGDVIGGMLTFPNVFRDVGAGAMLHSLTISDASVQSASLELWLFNGTVAPAADNAAHSITDAEAATCVAIVPTGTYYASALNSVSVKASIGLSMVGAAATSLYGILVSRGAPTYAGTADLSIRLVVIQD